MTFTAIIEPTNTGFSGYVAELEGQIIAAGETVDEVAQLLEEATENFVTELRAEGKPIPESQIEVRELYIA